MKKTYLELVVGVFLAIGIGCLAWLSIKLAKKDFFARNGYEVQASFSNAGGLHPGTPVVIAGVEIGRVKSVGLEEYEAKVRMVIEPGVVLQKDTIASIKTKGLIGEKYIEITPGASDNRIKAGGVIRDTQPAMDLEALIGKYIQGTLAKPDDKSQPLGSTR
jgi:phospholipid/cholesterol/gamma-HCH transport system substrate-binding protein